MRGLKKKYGEWACIAGAAEGLGKAFATTLAIRGHSLILIDMDEEKLQQTKMELVSQYHIDTILLHLDLVETGSVNAIIEVLGKQNCRLLIYNAAYGPVKPFLTNTEAELHRYIAVKSETQLHLIHRFISTFRDKSTGIMMVSSLAGFRGTRFVIPYAASKAFIWNMAEGLHYELQDTDIDVSVCVAGATDTPGFRSTKPKKWFLSPQAMDPKLVAEEALNNMGKRLFIFPGFSNKIAHFILNNLLPRKIASGIHNYTMKKMYE
jgi:short-subunit dehydrogenase